MHKSKAFLLAIMTFALVSFDSANAQTLIRTLAEFRLAVQKSNQNIVLRSGTYQLGSLASGSRVINCSGSNNTIDMTGATIKTEVGVIREAYFIVSGDDNIIKNGAIEDYYTSGLGEVTDFSAYNNDRDKLAYGLRGDPIMKITGDRNLVEGLEMTVKGSFPYGYGSQYGIGSTNTFGLSKRCGILITGVDGGGIGNTLDGITMDHQAFGHGIFMQNNATETLIKNCYIEGRMRLSDDMYNDTETYDLPYITNYTFPTGDDWRTLPFKESYPIPYDVVYPLSEDGIRSYTGSGSVTVENCTVKQMRGGIRLYLATSATVTNSKAIECGATNFNLPNGGSVTGSSGDFTYAPLNDFRLARSNQKIELTILPSPNAIGPHNIADIQGNNHDIVFHRTDGPLDTDENRVIVIYGDNSTIVNETEYDIVLDASANGNTIISCGGGKITDNGSNTIIENDDCSSSATPTCSNKASLLQAECYDDMSGVQIEGENIGFIKNGDWIKFNNIDLTSMDALEVHSSSKNTGGNVEIRLDSSTGTLLGTVPISSTGNWNNYKTVQANFTGVSGNRDIYFVFTGGSSYLFNVDWLAFSSTLSNPNLNLSKLEIYPNPTNSIITIKNSANSTLDIYNLQGSRVFSRTVLSDEESLDIGNLSAGIYIIKNKTATSVKKMRLIKM